MLEEAAETPLDALLVMQVKCFLISNQLTCTTTIEPFEQATKPASASTIAALQVRLDDVRRNAPAHILPLSEFFPILSILAPPPYSTRTIGV